VQRHITADAAECASLAAAFGLPGIASLTGDFILSEAPGQASGIIDAELSLHARVTQICVVSLEPFESAVAETARLRFLPVARLPEDADLAELASDGLEAPDEIPYAGDQIDLGAALAEQLALALDPFPRKPGAELPANAGSAAGNPFAALAARFGKPADGQG
jgi:hypothetical protein